MKKTLTLIAMLLTTTLFSYAATAKETNPHNKPHTASATLAAYEQAAREQQQLRKEIFALTELSEDLNSQLAYQKMMATMFQQLNQQTFEDKLADIKSELAFNKMMQQMLLRMAELQAK